MIKIDIAKKSDLGEVARLRFLAQKYASSFDPEIVISKKTKKELVKLTGKEFDDPRIIYLLAKENNRDVGLAILSLSPEIDRVAFLGELFVEEKYRGRGVGEQLIREAMKLAKKKELKKFRVTVARYNLSAQKFYNKLGFSLKEREYLLLEKEL